jgi:metal-responsive CopG/Arc/MetJ family transcriptional regulator
MWLFRSLLGNLGEYSWISTGDTKSSVRINISLPEETFKELLRDIKPRRRSRFIAQAVKSYFKELKKKQLAAEYEEAAKEIKRTNQEFEGALSDGLG